MILLIFNVIQRTVLMEINKTWNCVLWVSKSQNQNNKDKQKTCQEKK